MKDIYGNPRKHRIWKHITHPETAVNFLNRNAGQKGRLYAKLQNKIYELRQKSK